MKPGWLRRCLSMEAQERRLQRFIARLKGPRLRNVTDLVRMAVAQEREHADRRVGVWRGLFDTLKANADRIRDELDEALAREKLIRTHWSIALEQMKAAMDECDNAKIAEVEYIMNLFMRDQDPYYGGAVPRIVSEELERLKKARLTRKT